MSDGVFFFDDEHHVTPPRYFRLKPVGQGGNVESLASYVSRLAFAHRLTPRSFVEELVSPQDGSDAAFGLQRDWYQREGRDFIGVSARASLMADWLELNTGATGLRLCTLNSLSGLTCGQKLLTSSSRVCIKCLAEDQQNGTPMYERLLWRLEVVNACDLHRCALVELQCGNERPSRVIPKLPGVCRHCGSIGLKCCIDRDHDSVSEADIWVAHQCRNLLEAMPMLAQADQRPIKASLKAYWKSRGPLRAAAKATGISQQAVSEWLTEPSAKFSLFRLADIALVHHLDLVALVQGTIQPTVAPAGHGPRWRKRVFKRVDSAAVAQRLADALRAGESATHVVREMGVQYRAVAQHKDLSRQVKEAARIKRQDRDTQRRKQAVQQAEDVITRLLSENQTPSIRNASIQTGVKWDSSSLKAIALVCIRIRLGHTGVKPNNRSSSLSAELQGMLDDSADRIRKQFA